MAVRFGEKVGDAYVDVHARGDMFERELRRIASQGGTKGGQVFAEKFGQSVKKEGGTFEKAFRGIMGKFEGILRNEKNLRSFSDVWKGLGHNTKQWTLIIGAVLAGMQQIAVLGSAAAGGLLVLGGAATGAVVGLGSLIAAVVVLNRDLDKVPESIRPAAKAFQDLKEPLKDLQDFLAERAFRGTEKAFESIGQTIRKLTPSFGKMGDVINRLTTDFAAWLESNEGIELMSSLIENSAGIFDKLTRVTGKLGRALLLAFDNPRFQKAIDDMLTGLGGMFDQFAGFVASDDFGVWIDNISGVLGELGELIGATSDMFDDLITPAAYKRTEEFLQNLTDFMPHLGQLLDILGRLDVFGILAQLLADLGDALEPLAAPMGDLAEALGELISIAIDEWAKDLKPIAEALAPFVQALADFVKDIPPSVIRAIASALLYLGGALLIFKTIQWASMITGLTGFFGSIKRGGGIMKSFPMSKLGQFAKGLGAIGLLAATQLIPEDFWKQFDIESNLPNNVLTGAAFGAMFGGWGAVIGAGIGLVVSLFTDFENTMNDIGFGMLTLFGNGGAFGLFGASVATFFANLVPEEWRGSDNPLLQSLAAIAQIITDTGTVITLVGQMLGDFFAGLGVTIRQFAADTVATWTLLWRTLNNPAFWGAIGTSINNWINLIAAYIRGKLIEIGNAWRSFWAGLNTVVNGYWKLIVNTVTAFIVGVRAAIIGGLRGAASEWNAFWGGLPNAVAGAVSRIQGILGGLMSSIASALSGISNLGRQAGSVPSSVGGAGGRSQFASGGILSGPRRILAGEQGPEAIVPLRRNLSQVDPSVRWIAALAQGRTPAMASGGVVGGGKTNIVEAGAIVVQEASSALATGVEVLDRLSARMA